MSNSVEESNIKTCYFKNLITTVDSSALHTTTFKDHMSYKQKVDLKQQDETCVDLNKVHCFLWIRFKVKLDVSVNFFKFNTNVQSMNLQSIQNSHIVGNSLHTI